MRLILIAALLPLIASVPATACDMEGAPEFSHYSAYDDPYAAAAARASAVAEAQARFINRFRRNESAATEVAVASDAGTATPPQD